MKTRMIPSYTHGIIDYAMSAALIAAPFILASNRKTSETMIPIMGGLSSTVSSIFTDYELGAKRMIPLKQHLNLDIALGAFMAVAPWLLGFKKKSAIPLSIIGAMEVATALMTEKRPRH